MGKIRRNALNYSVKYYAEILLENLDTISDTKEKFHLVQSFLINDIPDISMIQEKECKKHRYTSHTAAQY